MCVRAHVWADPRTTRPTRPLSPAVGKAPVQARPFRHQARPWRPQGRRHARREGRRTAGRKRGEKFEYGIEPGAGVGLIPGRRAELRGQPPGRGAPAVPVIRDRPVPDRPSAPRGALRRDRVGRARHRPLYAHAARCPCRPCRPCRPRRPRPNSCWQTVKVLTLSVRVGLPTTTGCGPWRIGAQDVVSDTRVMPLRCPRQCDPDPSRIRMAPRSQPLLFRQPFRRLPRFQSFSADSSLTAAARIGYLFVVAATEAGVPPRGSTRVRPLRGALETTMSHFRQCITTRYAGPTDATGSRVIARSQAGRTVHYWDHALDVDENHAAAAHAHASRRGWVGTWHGGALPSGDGYAFVVVTDGSSIVTP